MSEFKFEIIENLGELSDKRGYAKEVNIISFNGGDERLDIRTWFKGSMLKGISLTEDEAQKLYECLHNQYGQM